jgi:8-oxo-dGTP pyrophosphatase MutT (NUDIX family)
VQKSSTIAIINEKDQILILKRGKTAPWMPGRYCLPGGKVEKNEDLINAAIRELFEETNIVCAIEGFFIHNVQYSNGKSKIVFSARINNPIVKLNWEHEDYAWIDIESIKDYDLVPGLKTSLTVIFKHMEFRKLVKWAR